MQDVALPTSKDEIMSSLMQQSMDNGKFWFHELVYSSFESADNPAWAAIREIIPNLNEFAIVTDTELNAFVEGKMEQCKHVLQSFPSLHQLEPKCPFGIIRYQILRERPSFHTRRQLSREPYIRVIEELAEPKVCSSG